MTNVSLLRCPPLMDIVLHMLNGYLLASKAYLHCHLKETADFDRQSQTISNLGLAGQPDTPEVTREELKNALLAAQVDALTKAATCKHSQSLKHAHSTTKTLLILSQAPTTPDLL